MSNKLINETLAKTLQGGFPAGQIATITSALSPIMQPKTNLGEYPYIIHKGTYPENQPEKVSLFSFRAECPNDIRDFLNAFTQNKPDAVLIVTNGVRDAGFPDCMFELVTDVDLETVRDIMRLVQDGHVMVQSLRQLPMSENSMKRDTGFD